MNASLCDSFLVFRQTGWAAVLYPALLQPVLPLRAPMKFADPRLILTASSKLERVFRFGESWSYLACHHTRLLRNLSTFTLCQTLIF
ncbi:hypothetical protein AYM40_07485 [Paraburkholderia phytofirmans OLGA172]|jgi:hypothetical protein|uniref:Uncharacterized protein n=1 Tax=Paraburkholderia phytofirmans OLGA172 TaxID=1417228 RepID=A0A160FIZ5_9BURK|nr:hypothetical protein AYM40_07485 [Paraburkholderia phytofirmans OLGA172]